jgi:hypothetical protein
MERTSTGARAPCCNMLKCARAHVRCNQVPWQGLGSCKNNNIATIIFSLSFFFKIFFNFFLDMQKQKNQIKSKLEKEK